MKTEMKIDPEDILELVAYVILGGGGGGGGAYLMVTANTNVRAGIQLPYLPI